MPTGRRSMYQLCSSSYLLVRNDIIEASSLSLLAYESVRVFSSVLRFGLIVPERSIRLIIDVDGYKMNVSIMF